MIALPDSLRSAFKDPFGPVYTDTEQLLAAVDECAADSEVATPPLIAVGDVVSHHLLDAGRQPDVAIVDGKTERETVDTAVAASIADSPGVTRHVTNPPAALAETLLSALCEALESTVAVTIHVDGEEDLATLPAIVAAPRGSSVVYGQPGEGMVHVAVTEKQTADARALLARFNGDTAAALQLLERH